jgi:hypothetical protein
MVSYRAKQAIVERIEAIAVWRQEREFQDMLGLGPEAAQRSHRSAEGLRELAAYVDKLGDDDERIATLMRLAFSGEYFDPGALLLTELGRFRFHDPDQPVSQFFDAMVRLAEKDREEMGQWGGPQPTGDNPWGANWIVELRDPDEEEADW